MNNKSAELAILKEEMESTDAIIKKQNEKIKAQLKEAGFRETACRFKITRRPIQERVLENIQYALFRIGIYR